MMYIIFSIFTILFVIYFYYQAKIKNNKNYPITLAMGLAFLVLMTNGSIEWLIKSANKNFGWEIEIPHTLSIYEIGLFFILLYSLSALYYKHVFGEIFIQKNNIFSIFQHGNNEQNNRKR